MKIITNSSAQTKKLGADFAKKIMRKKNKKALVLGLKGDLGSGKTTFLQGFAKGLGIKQKVLSPTFLIMKKLKRTGSNFFYHFDCYRVRKPKEILSLGFKEIISNPENIIGIEWADRVKKILPKNTVWIGFEFVDRNKRKVQIRNKVFRFLRS